MSFQSKNDIEIEKQVEIEVPQKMQNFEKHIIQCCKAPEWELRKWLRKVLTRSGFIILEDKFQSERVKKNKNYESVHNMVAIRGENPLVCLAAHTDVCRDHEDEKFIYEEDWMRGEASNSSEKTKRVRKVEPVIKIVETDDGVRRIIQDKDCALQVGGDDRLGVAINTWIALNSGYDMGLFFPTDEEIGLRSAGMVEIQELKSFDLIVQTDRGNHSNELVTEIGGEKLIGFNSASRLLEIAYDLGLPRAPVRGLSTDVVALKRRGMCKEAVNMTVGYHESHGAGPNEYIDIQEAYDTMRYVSEIVKDYYINGSTPQ